MASRRIRRSTGATNRLDGNLQLPGESLRVAFANTYAYCNGNATATATPTATRGAEVYADTAAASHAAASALRPAFNGRFLRGLAMIASPRNAYFS